jgi:hypothetical protein
VTQPDAAFRSLDPMTSPGAHADQFDNAPHHIAGVAAMVQGLILHEHWAERYGQKLAPERRAEVHIRPVEGMLDALLAHDPSPIAEARSADKRIVGNCRDFTLMSVAMLRSSDVPARARCGFGAYFNPGTFEDHWVVEYWHARRSRWELADAQLDAIQQEALKIDFKPLDVPRDRFIVAGQAWADCRAGKADPSKFGIFDMRGLWFIAGDLIRDAAALNNHVMLPWDVWGSLMQQADTDADLTEEMKSFLDHVAALTLDPDRNHDELRRLYETDERLTVPGQVYNAIANRTDTL